MRKLTMVVATTVAAAALLTGVGGAVAAPPGYFPDFEQDAEVATATSPATAVVGDFALLSSIVTNHGPYGAPIVFNDTVPTGLSINSTAAGSGTCTTSGQTVACRLALAPGESAPVNIVVTPTAAGTYSNKVTVAPGEGQLDRNSGNDNATATMTVVAAPAVAPVPTCTVPSLKRTPQPVARRVLGLLHCKAGKATRAHSRGVARGQVIRTTPKPGTYKQGKVVALTISSGPAKARRGR